MLDGAELTLVNPWQRGFPLCRRPFGEIAARANLREAAVLEKFRDLQARGVIDRIGPVFRPNTVGASTLAAISAPPERLQAAAAQVSAQPGVNHNYERGHLYNLWFVVTGSSETEVRQRIDRIEYSTGLPVLPLPLLEEFHIDLGFDLDTHAAPRTGAKHAAPPLSADERRLVACVSQGLPLVPEPYQAIADSLNENPNLTPISEQRVIALLERMLGDGRIRRIGAVIRHRRLGYVSNAMVVWDVPDAQAGELGRRLASDAAVTLCYRRARALPDWRYNLYCMVHGRERERVLREVARASAAHGLDAFPRCVLFSTRCFSQKAASYG